MEWEMEARRIKTSTAISKPSETLSQKIWLKQELTRLASAYGTTLTATRLELNAEDLLDLPGARLKEAFRAARKQCEYFPSVAKLRELAGSVPGATGPENSAAYRTWQSPDYMRPGFQEENLMGKFIEHIDEFCRKKGFGSIREEQGKTGRGTKR